MTDEIPNNIFNKLIPSSIPYIKEIEKKVQNIRDFNERKRMTKKFYLELIKYKMNAIKRFEGKTESHLTKKEWKKIDEAYRLEEDMIYVFDYKYHEYLFS